MAAFALSACQNLNGSDFGVPEARAIEYDVIRNQSGVLGYAEPLLGPAFATAYVVPVGRGAAVAERARVAGAWELPAHIDAETLAARLRDAGTLERVRDHQSGQIWIADHQRPGQPRLRLLFINGRHPMFARNAAPAVQPGAHIYLIAYRHP